MEGDLYIITTLGVYRTYGQDLVGLYYRGFILEDHLCMSIIMLHLPFTVES